MEKRQAFKVEAGRHPVYTFFLIYFSWRFLYFVLLKVYLSFFRKKCQEFYNAKNFFIPEGAGVHYVLTDH